MIEEQSWRDVKAPGSLRARVLSGQPSRPAWVWRGAMAATCALLIGLATLLPQRSSAATSLARLVEAQEHSTVMFHLTSYTIDAGVSTPKVWSGYVKGNRWHYIQSDFEQAFDGVRTMTYHSDPVLGVSASTELGSDHGSGGILGSADLSVWKVADRKNLTMDHDTTWRGQKVDRYTMTFHFRDGKGVQREGISRLYADPKRNLPLYEEDMYSATSGNALEWDYVDPANDDLLRIKLPAGIQIREVTPQTNPTPLGSPEKSKDR